MIEKSLKCQFQPMVVHQRSVPLTNISLALFAKIITIALSSSSTADASFTKSCKSRLSLPHYIKTPKTGIFVSKKN